MANHPHKTSHKPTGTMGKLIRMSPSRNPQETRFPVRRKHLKEFTRKK